MSDICDYFLSPRGPIVLQGVSLSDWISPLLFISCFFVGFLQRLSGRKHSQMGKLGPTASNFGYDFSAENGRQRGYVVGPKIITKIGCCWAIFSHIHD